MLSWLKNRYLYGKSGSTTIEELEEKLRSFRDNLRTVLDQVRSLRDQHEKDMTKIQNETAKLSEGVISFYNLLAEYGDHLPSCANRQAGENCTCGWEQLEADLFKDNQLN